MSTTSCPRAGEFLCDEDLVNESGKMALLDRMLTILARAGHRVLIFCQMRRMLVSRS